MNDQKVTLMNPFIYPEYIRYNVATKEVLNINYPPGKFPELTVYSKGAIFKNRNFTNVDDLKIPAPKSSTAIYTDWDPDDLIKHTPITITRNKQPYDVNQIFNDLKKQKQQHGNGSSSYPYDVNQIFSDLKNQKQQQQGNESSSYNNNANNNNSPSPIVYGPDPARGSKEEGVKFAEVVKIIGAEIPQNDLDFIAGVITNIKGWSNRTFVISGDTDMKDHVTIYKIHSETSNWGAQRIGDLLDYPSHFTDNDKYIYTTIILAAVRAYSKTVSFDLNTMIKFPTTEDSLKLFVKSTII